MSRPADLVAGPVPVNGWEKDCDVYWRDLNRNGLCWSSCSHSSHGATECWMRPSSREHDIARTQIENGAKRSKCDIQGGVVVNCGGCCRVAAVFERETSLSSAGLIWERSGCDEIGKGRSRNCSRGN